MVEFHNAKLERPAKATKQEGINGDKLLTRFRGASAIENIMKPTNGWR